MSTDPIKLSPEQTAQLQKIDGAIQSRSLEVGRLLLTLRQMEANLSGLYDFRNNLIKQALQAADVPQENIRVEVDSETGQISVQTNDDRPGAALNPDAD